MRKRSRQQYRMKERQNRDEFEIRKAKRGHGADQRGIVGGLERETVPGTEVVASHPERRKQKQGRGGQTEADGSEGRCLRSLSAVPERNLLRIVHRDEVRRRKAPEVTERVPDRYGSSRTLRRNLLHIRGRGERVERVLRVIISAVDERAEQQRLERRYDLTTEEKVRIGTWTNMQQ